MNYKKYSKAVNWKSGHWPYFVKKMKYNTIIEVLLILCMSLVMYGLISSADSVFFIAS